MICSRDHVRFGLVGLVGVGLIGMALGLPPLSSAEITPQTRQALEKNAAALSPLTVAWEQRRSSPFTPQELVKRLRWRSVDPSFTEPENIRFITQDGMCFQRHTFRVRQDGTVQETTTEVASDLKHLYRYTAMAPPVFFIQPLDYQGGLRPTTAPVVLTDRQGGYFFAAGFKLPDSPSTFGQAPQSLVLSLINDGAHVTASRQEPWEGEADHVVVELRGKDRTYRFYLDPAMNYAVRRHEQWSESKELVVAVDNYDFVRMPRTELWLPKRTHAEWRTWNTIPQEVAGEPLVFIDIAVSELDNNPVPLEQFVLHYKNPGAIVADARIVEPNASGYVTYNVPADLRDLDEAIEAAKRGKQFVPGRRRSLSLYLILLGVNAAAFAAWLIWRRFARRPAS